MKKIIAICLLLFVFSTFAKGQTSSNVVYFELLGPGIASFNYDTRFTKKQNGWGGRIGIGGFGDRQESILTIPLGINYITSGDDKHYFEVGINHTFVNANAPIFDFGDISSKNFTTLNFGYRRQPLKNGFVFRAALNPIIVDGAFNPFYFGISFGYKF